MPMRQTKKRGKTALVLAGGGVTGAVYEIGALRAIDDLLVDRTVNDFDIYVGTSAGALVCALLASGLSPQSMLSVFEGAHPNIRPVESTDILALNRLDLLRWGTSIPRRLASISLNYFRNLSDMTFFDLLWSLAEVLPAGLYDGQTLERYVHEVLAATEHSDRLADVQRELYLVATDLNTGERAVFSREENRDVAISAAVAASTALPPVYKPVRIGNRVLVDGGMRGTASLDLAIESGADLIVCINPLVPYDNSKWDDEPFFGPEGGYLSKKGLQAMLSQVSRISTHAGLHYQIKQIRRQHPEVDIILIEPAADDCQMFYYNIMRYSVLMLLARHGFESVTLRLAEDYSFYKEILARHGIALSRRLVISELREIQESGYQPEVIRQVLEKRSLACDAMGRKGTLVSELAQTLAILELTLDDMSELAA